MYFANAGSKYFEMPYYFGRYAVLLVTNFFLHYLPFPS